MGIVRPCLESVERERERETFQCSRILILGRSLAAWWLGFRAFTAVAWVQSVVGDLRPRKHRARAARPRKIN